MFELLKSIKCKNCTFVSGNEHSNKHNIPRESKCVPIVFEFNASENVSFCTCKLSNIHPYCDGKHKSDKWFCFILGFYIKATNY